MATRKQDLPATERRSGRDAHFSIHSTKLTVRRYKRSEKLLFVQIFQQGRDATTKQKLYRSLADSLAKECGLRGEDLIVTCSSNAKEDWSFGMGRAQFLDGGL